MFALLRTRQWVAARRIILVAIVLVVAYRTYGPLVRSKFGGPNPQHDIVITHSEFRSDIEGEKPAWIVSLRNSSRRFTYDQVQLEATYSNDGGTVLETDKLVLRRKLVPGDEQTVGSFDLKNRPGATRGTLKVLDAGVVK